MTSYFFFFFFNDTAPTEIYTLSLHDALPVPQIKKGVTTRDEVLRLIGRPGGKYAYPLISDPKGQADVYLYAESSGNPFNVKFYQKHLVVTYDNRGVVSNVEYQEVGQK